LPPLRIYPFTIKESDECLLTFNIILRSIPYGIPVFLDKVAEQNLKKEMDITNKKLEEKSEEARLLTVKVNSTLLFVRIC